MNSIIDQQRELVWISDPVFWDYYNECGRDFWRIEDEDLTEESTIQILKDSFHYRNWALGYRVAEVFERIKSFCNFER